MQARRGLTTVQLQFLRIKKHTTVHICIYVLLFFVRSSAASMSAHNSAQFLHIILTMHVRTRYIQSSVSSFSLACLLPDHVEGGYMSPCACHAAIIIAAISTNSIAIRIEHSLHLQHSCTYSCLHAYHVSLHPVQIRIALLRRLLGCRQYSSLVHSFMLPQSKAVHAALGPYDVRCES
jgi:hypothetical protein